MLHPPFISSAENRRESETVVLLHGLARSTQSMAKLEKALKSEGYQVSNLSYPSRKYAVSELALQIRSEIESQTTADTKIHFVTHSMGGIVLRYIQKSAPLPNIGRVVMLSPPNQGSEVVDTIGHWKLFKRINGPAGQQLGTASSSLVNKLGPVNFECGIITGDRSINWINSVMIPEKDDGKVSVESAKVEGMTDFKVVHVTHPMIMKRQAVINDAIRFLQSGSFEGE